MYFVNGAIFILFTAALITLDRGAFFYFRIIVGRIIVCGIAEARLEKAERRSYIIERYKSIVYFDIEVSGNIYSIL